MNDLTIREKKLLEYALAQANTMLDDALLNECADLEYRICLLELGITQLMLG